ncbi:ABC transporter ATP-binding protein [Nonomuraea sp. SYSU D8015]|uniref:ABC transporter ATP-binding protein n=1 Tax=Nonomuraea sp. SYSU D8015 TaxID=2593644 RepID=UPI0021D32639|nr:ATP-binding cassette domain-containing protein [Nonomuraea sp. SYSU D8015]
MRLSKISFRYRRRGPFVIEDADTELSPGDVIELTGVNGAGKSTLLRLLAGLARPTQGTITGRPEVVGFAPDRFPTGQPFTVTAYLRHMSRIRGGARWEPWAERLTMGHLLALPLGELSKGSAHKVGLVQALMAEPGLLILDEPFAGLDADTRDVLPSIAAEVAGRGGIVVASDHQGGLRGLTALRRWSLIDGHLKEGTTAPAPASPAVPTQTAGPAQTPATMTPHTSATVPTTGTPHTPTLTPATGRPHTPDPAGATCTPPTPTLTPATGAAHPAAAGSVQAPVPTPATGTTQTSAHPPAAGSMQTPAHARAVNAAQTPASATSSAEGGAAGRSLTTVAVTLPADDLPEFLARMRDEGYRTHEIEETG